MGKIYRKLLASRILSINNSKRTPTYPWSIPQASPKPQMKGIPNHKLLVGGLGYVPGVCWKILRTIFPYNQLFQTLFGIFGPQRNLERISTFRRFTYFSTQWWNHSLVLYMVCRISTYMCIYMISILNDIYLNLWYVHIYIYVLYLRFYYNLSVIIISIFVTSLISKHEFSIVLFFWGIGFKHTVKTHQLWAPQAAVTNSMLRLDDWKHLPSKTYIPEIYPEEVLK